MPNLVNPKSSWACLPPGGGEGVWSASVSIQAALCEAKFFGSSTISSPLQVHAIAKVSAKRAPNIGNIVMSFSGSSDSARPKSMVCVRAVPFRKQRNMRLSVTTTVGAAGAAPNLGLQ